MCQSEDSYFLIAIVLHASQCLVGQASGKSKMFIFFLLKSSHFRNVSCLAEFLGLNTYLQRVLEVQRLKKVVFLKNTFEKSILRSTSKKLGQALIAVQKCHFKAPITITVTNKLERLQRKFFWDAVDGTRKFHLVRWEIVTSPKWRGVLGVKDLKFFDKALLYEWLWRCVVYGEFLWIRVIADTI